MGRRDYRYVTLPCSLGINEEADLDVPGECASALNLWAPRGRVETRPGYWPHFNLFPIDATTNVSPSDVVVVQERINSVTAGFTNWTSVDGVTSIAMTTDLVAGDRLYFGVSDDLRNYMMMEFRADNQGNSAAYCAVAWSYYNGTSWAPLSANWVDETDGKLASLGANFLKVHASDRDGSVSFTMPQDAATTSVNSSGERYWLRATIIDGTVGGTIDFDIDFVKLWSTGNVELAHYDIAEINGNHWHLRASNTKRGTGSGTDISEAYIGDRPGHRADWLSDVGNPSGVRYFDADEPGSVAVVPEFGEAFGSFFQQRMLEYGRVQPGDDASSDATVGRARVEWRDFAVGEKAPFDPAFIVQETEFPRAKYLLHFKGLLWAAGIRGEPYTVRWSAPVPFHRVWPTLSFERLMEDDDSPITGLAALAEQVVIFKRDSIWMMLPVGQNAFGLTDFAPTRVVAGVGCVSNQSIRRVRGRLIFLSEGGVYAFDGTPNLTKVSDNSRGADRLINTWGRITKSRRAWASGVNWKSQDCYLLGVSLDGARENTHTIVWDYGAGAWWLWDIPAQMFFKAESAADEEEIWFVRSDGAVCKLGGRHDNHAGISSNLTTHRMRYGDTVREVFRVVEVVATNKTGSITAQIIPDDNTNAYPAATIDFANRTDVPAERRIERRIGIRAVGDHAQIKLTHDVANARFKLKQIQCGFLPLGRR